MCLHEKIHGHTHSTRHVDSQQRVVRFTHEVKVNCAQCGVQLVPTEVLSLSSQSIMFESIPPDRLPDTPTTAEDH